MREAILQFDDIRNLRGFFWNVLRLHSEGDFKMWLKSSKREPFISTGNDYANFAIEVHFEHESYILKLIYLPE